MLEIFDSSFTVYFEAGSLNQIQGLKIHLVLSVSLFQGSGFLLLRLEFQVALHLTLLLHRFSGSELWSSCLLLANKCLSSWSHLLSNTVLLHHFKFCVFPTLISSEARVTLSPCTQNIWKLSCKKYILPKYNKTTKGEFWPGVANFKTEPQNGDSQHAIF